MCRQTGGSIPGIQLPELKLMRQEGPERCGTGGTIYVNSGTSPQSIPTLNPWDAGAAEAREMVDRNRRLETRRYWIGGLAICGILLWYAAFVRPAAEAC